jgi:hypothetical protein
MRESSGDSERVTETVSGERGRSDGMERLRTRLNI